MTRSEPRTERATLQKPGLESNILRASAPYVTAYAVLMAFVAARGWAPLDSRFDLLLEAAFVTAALALFSRSVLNLRAKRVLGSIVLGTIVFALWIAPEVFFPNYRRHWLFDNSMLGGLGSPFPEALRGDGIALSLRCLRAAVLVPIVEELFWRAWLMRWLIDPRFERIPLGLWQSGAFWMTAALFACEHGAYWDVGLLAGVLYNFWMVRTKSLGDCVLAHAVTNACLCAYVILGGHWQYWS